MNLNFTEPACSVEKQTSFLQRHADTIRFLMKVSGFYMAAVVLGMQVLLANSSNGQSIETIEVTTELKEGEKLSDLFKSIEHQSGLLFAFTEEVNQYAAIVSKGKRTIKETLDIALVHTPFTYQQLENKVLIYALKQTGNDRKLSSQGAENVTLVTLVSGIVKDAATMAPMAGVNIIVKGTTRGTSSDANGRFSIEANENDILVFSFIGYKTYETLVSAQSNVEIALEPDIEALNEVVINAGYWHVTREGSTGNISRVSSEVIGTQPVTNPLLALHGRMPGVYIEQSNGVPGSNVTIRIRGQNSLLSGNDPLYIVDGVPFISGTLSDINTAASILGTGGANPLNGINPEDIESIEVLKDADATAIYGSRGANGVVLITTKKGKIGSPVLDLNVYTGVSKVANRMDMLHTLQYLQMRREAFKNDGLTPRPNDYDLTVWDSTRNTDWQKELLGGNARITNMQASISGGNSETQFVFSSSYNSQGTVFPGDFSVNKISSHFSLSHTSLNQKFKTTFSLGYVINTSNLLNTDLTSIALRLPPNAPKLYDENGKLNWENSTWRNPLSYLEATYKSKANNLFSNAVLSYEVTRGLDVKVNMGINDIKMVEKNLTPSSFYNPALNPTPEWASIYLNTGAIQSWILEPQVSWGREFGNGKLSVLMGTTFQERNGEQMNQEGFGFSSDALIEDISAAFEDNIRNNIISTYRYSAIFARLNYSLSGKYLLNFTGRRDGSSRFGPGKQFGNFGAVGVAWIFSNEPFVETVAPILSFGKIRFSYGASGNDQIGDYNFLSTLSSGTGYQGTNGLYPKRLFNPDFSWEINKKFEGGLEIGVNSNRIVFAASYYHNRSSNQLVNYPLTMTTGFNGILANLPATIKNEGWEFELNTANIKSNTFEWSTSLNVTVPRNKLLEFPGLATSSYANSYVIGEPITIARRYHYLGVDSETGDFLFEDMNQDGTISSADRLAIVKRHQTFFGGLNNSISYKGFQLDVFLQFVKQSGANFWAQAGSPGRANINQPVDVIEYRWQNPGDEAALQRFSTLASQNYSRYASSDAVIEDASFIRVKNVSFSYHIPDTLLRGIKGRVYLTGQNLFTITNYFGLDPENGLGSVLPPLRTFTIGIQVSL